MSEQDITQITTNILFHLSSWMSKINPQRIRDPIISLQLRRFIHYVYLFLTLQLTQHNINFDHLHLEYLSHYRYLMWRIHNMYGTRPTTNIYEIPEL